MAHVINDRTGAILFKGSNDDCVCFIAENGFDLELDSCVYIDETPFGVNEGDICNRDECVGIIKLQEIENCSCHIIAPCPVCTAVITRVRVALIGQS